MSVNGDITEPTLSPLKNVEDKEIPIDYFTLLILQLLLKVPIPRIILGWREYDEKSILPLVLLKIYRASPLGKPVATITPPIKNNRSLKVFKSFIAHFSIVFSLSALTSALIIRRSHRSYYEEK